MATAKAVRERPILMSAPMVRAILDGRKTVTRRLCKLRDPSETYSTRDDDGWPESADHYGDWHRDPCPYGEPGDRLWVRETWQDYCPIWNGHWCGHGDLAGKIRDHRPVYRADDESLWPRGPEGEQQPPAKWKPSIFMPRWASRITLRITDVRVERLHAITEADAMLEGVGLGLLPENVGLKVCQVCGQHRNSHNGALNVCPERSTSFCVRSHRDGFAILWDQINGAGSWASSPWVWVVAFEREHTP